MAGDTLRAKSLTQLRGIAQSFNVPDIFAKDVNQLAQAIEMKQQLMQPKIEVNIPLPQYDARLMTKPPSKKLTMDEAREYIADYVAQGLHIEIGEETWKMSYGKKTDQGTLRMPARTFLDCARKVMS